ncbi:MAG: VOC family protein [Myxococcota bacterium]
MTRIHLSLRTPDLDAATTFYTALLGAAPDKVRDGYVRFAPAGVPIVLSLMPGEATVDHFGLRVEEAEADGTFAALSSTGLPVSPSEVVCCHAEKQETWMRDPDGRAWEVYAVTDDAPARAATPTRCCA